MSNIEESTRQSAKEEAVKLALTRGMALIRRDLEIHGMFANGETRFISRSTDYDSLWKDALNVLQKGNENQKMKKNVLSIEIKAPVEAVFEFTRNPNNSPKWVPNILEEKIDTPSTEIGTIYRQKIKEGGKVRDSAIVVTGYVENERLDFHAVNGAYSCSYMYQKTPSGTRLTYSEENGVDGEIDGPFSMAILEKLKQLIEEG
ncbi:MAG: SRPBCC family protein [Candidatus Diapherotrites archaeon]|nr:SRPBCC family protein [Candidatus Diapherotrites archaeon]